MKKNNKVFLFVIFAGIFWFNPIIATATPPNDSYNNPLDEILRLQGILRSDSENVKAHNHLGILYMELERYQEAINEFENALEIKPYYPMGPIFSGNVYTDADRYQEQIDKFQEVIQTNRGYAKAHNNLGLVYLTLGNYEKARKEFEEAIKIDPTSLKPHNNLGILYEKLGENELAISKYQDALMLEPDNATTLHNLSLVNDFSNDENHSIQPLIQASNKLNEKQGDLKNPFSLQPAVNFGAGEKGTEFIISSQPEKLQAGPLNVETSTSSQGIDSSESQTVLETNKSVDTAKVPKELTARNEVQEPESEANPTADSTLEDTNKAPPKEEPSEKIKILTVTADIQNKDEVKKENNQENLEEETSQKPSFLSLDTATRNTSKVAETQNPDPVLGDWLFQFPK